jgi:ABC-type nitrate/sulfonate/bicarbonate transport system substrate-binding protein
MEKTSFLKIGGVPEHFNLPWIQAFQKQKLQSIGIETNWIFFPGGTGAMTNALHSGDLDVAILLTEGFLAAFQKGLKAKIIQCYIETPLQWGIYSNKKDELYFDTTTKIAVSRKGSGSHLMPLIHSEMQGKILRDDQFKVIHHLEDGIASLHEDCDYFYWEKWMTQPFVDRGQCKMIGEFHAPWSSFLIVASDKCIEEQAEQLLLMLKVIEEQVQCFLGDPDTPLEISKQFQLSPENAEKWLSEQEWHHNHNVIHQNEIINAMNALQRVGIDMKQVKLEELFAPWITLAP